jgi:hypothetical protein
VATIERRPNTTVLVCAVALAFTLGLVWVVAWTSDGANEAGEHEALPSTTAVPASTTSSRNSISTSTTTIAPVPTTSMTTLGVELPSASGVVLFAHTADPNAVVRIEVDRGRVFTTPIGPVFSTAPAFLAVGPYAVVVRPYDNVRGYVVSDSGTVTDPTGLLAHGTFMTCSDGSRDRVWVADESLIQVDFSGALKAQVGGESRPTPIGCDGAGEMLYRSGADILVTRDGPPALVTSKTVVAAGPRTFVVNECTEVAACSLTVIDRRTGARRPLLFDPSAATPQRLPGAGQARVGTISPDGRTAVLFRSTRETVVVDLVSGIGQGVNAIAGDSQSFVWSTDSRYLFFIGGGYRLSSFDRDTRQVQMLGVNNVFALAGRPS